MTISFASARVRMLAGAIIALGVTLPLGQLDAASAPSKNVTAGASSTQAVSSASHKKSARDWRLVYSEYFGGRPGPLVEATPLVLDTYGPDSSYQQRLAAINDIPFSDNGQFWTHWGGQSFLDQLNTFRTYRKSFAFGKDDWLT